MHAVKSEEMSKQILRRLKFDNDTIMQVSHLIRYHDDRPEGQMKSVRRAVNRIGRNFFHYILKSRKQICWHRANTAVMKRLPGRRA